MHVRPPEEAMTGSSKSEGDLDKRVGTSHPKFNVPRLYFTSPAQQPVAC